MKEDPAERRAHPRIAAQVEAQGAPEDGSVVARLVTHNLSMGGVFCTSAAAFPEMTRLAIRLMLPVETPGNGQTEPVEVEAVVVRSVPLAESETSGAPRYELGLYFTHMSDDAREQLQRFLD